MSYAVLLCQTDNRAKIIQCEGDVLHECYRVIDCDSVQLVPEYPGRLPKGYEAVCDENTWGKTLFINPLASWIYGADIHGAAIMGNAVVLKIIDTKDGEDLAFMTEEEATALAEELNKDFETKYDLAVFTVMREIMQ